MVVSRQATPARRWTGWLLDRLTALTLVYGTFLALWVITRGLFGDRWWWLFMLNSFAVYLFVPLPLALLVALLTRQRAARVVVAGATALLLWLYGGLWLPGWPPADSVGARVRVMSYNMLGFTDSPELVIATIRQSRADIVTIQELNPLAAAQIARDLRDAYPYQELDPQDGVFGMGVISRLPLRPSDLRLPGDIWPIRPQLLTVDVAGRPVTLVHVHPVATTPGPIDYMEQTIRIREQQTAWLIEALAGHPNPVLMPIDFNSTDQNANYAAIRQIMDDAWRSVGWGPGHTFPSDAPGGWQIGGLKLPWLVRIDYVFHSRHWTAVSAETAPWDGASDHRPVIADLVLREAR